MVTFYATTIGIGITWESIAIDIGIAILFFALYCVFEKQGKDELKYASFFYGASNLICTMCICCCPMIADKINSLL